MPRGPAETFSVVVLRARSWAVGERQEHVGDESRPLLNGQDPLPDVVGQVLQRRHREAADPAHQIPALHPPR